MGKADAGAIQAVKAKLDFVEIVRRYVDLRLIGGRWAGPCPFHQETKPSFYVHADQGFYHCFGCQASGDVIDFYQRVNGLDFKDALTQLAAEAGVELGAARAADPEDRKRRELERVCREMHSLAAEYFVRNLGTPGGAAAKRYLEGRGISPEIVESFRLGCSLDDWQGLHTFLQGKGYSADLGVQAGLLAKSDKSGRCYDRFRNRLIFPIVSLSGQIVAFGGRVLGAGGENEPKYLNSADSPIYKKGEHLYGLYQARPFMAKSRRALLTEGYVDVLTLRQYGYAEAVGVLGTALTPEQVKRLSGFCAEVDLLFDGDAAGRKAALRSCEMILGQGVKCRVVRLPDGEDADSLLRGAGREAFEACLAGAVDGLDFCLETVRGSESPREIVNWARGFLKSLRDQAWRAFYLPRLAEGLGLAEAEFRRSLFEAVPAAAPTEGVGREDDRRRGPGNGEPGRAPLALRRELGEIEAANARRLRDARAGWFDRQALALAVAFPERLDELVGLGLEELLDADESVVFWRKLLAFGDDEILLHLDEEEVAFFTRCRLMDEKEKAALADLFIEVAAHYEEKRRTLTLGALRDAVTRAQASDPDRAFEELKSLHDSLRRRDE